MGNGEQKSCRIGVVYCSIGGNTARVAKAMQSAINSHGLPVDLIQFKAEQDIDIFAYNLIFFGAPVYDNLAPLPVMKFLSDKKKSGGNLAAAPEMPGRYAVVFCTYGGAHTGIGEAMPLLKYMGQIFEHKGYRVVEEWPLLGEFPTAKTPAYNTAGRLGNVMGRPNQHDLDMVAGQTSGLLRRLQHKLGIAEHM
jgi:flavodoxin I